MTAFAPELSLVGLVLAVSLAIILVAGLALYVSFRVRETLREERGTGAKVVKVALLVGLLFLSGGVFYFFAITNSQGHNFSNSTTSLSTTTSTHTTSTSSTPLTTTSSTASTTSSTIITSSGTSSRTTSTSSSSGQTALSVTISFPSNAAASSKLYGSFTIINNGTYDANSSTIQTGNLFNQFTFQSCAISENGGTSQNCSASGSVISLGSIAPGTTVVTLNLTAPSQPGQYSDTITLYYYLGVQRSNSSNFTMRVSG